MVGHIYYWYKQRTENKCKKGIKILKEKSDTFLNEISIQFFHIDLKEKDDSQCDKKYLNSNLFLSFSSLQLYKWSL